MITRSNRFDSTDHAKVLCELIQSQLELPEGSVMIYNQKWNIPSTPGVFVSLGFEWSKVFGTTIQVGDGERQPDGTTGLVETTSCNVQERWTATIFSRSPEARLRCHEIALALNSTEAQQLQEQYSFKIANVPEGPIDISREEGTAIIYAFQVRFSTLRAYEKTRVIDYFDKFSVPPEIHTNQ